MEKDENREHWADESGDELLDDSFLTNPLPNLPKPEKPPVRKAPRAVRGMVQNNHQSNYSQKAHNSGSKPPPSSMRNSFNQKKNYTKRNAGSNRSQNNRDNNKHPPPSPLKSNSDKDVKLISNYMAHSLRRLRGEIVTVHLLSGESFEGVLDNVDVMHGMNVTLLQSQKQVEKGARNTNEFKEMYNIEGSDIGYLRAVEKTTQVYNQRKKSGGFIDSEVGGQRIRKERELKRWEPGTSPDGDQLCEPLCELGTGPRDEKWDQFKANQVLGVSSSMDAFEQTYTTPIDRGSNFYKKHEKRAEELANQIEQNTVKHKHILLERERGNKLASNMSPESMFSQVFSKLNNAEGRGKQKSTKKPSWPQDVPAADVPLIDPAAIALPRIGRYVVPHKRKIYEKLGIHVGGLKKDNRTGSKNTGNAANQTDGRKEGVKRSSEQHSNLQQQPTVTPSKREPMPRRRTPPHSATPTSRQKEMDLSVGKQNAARSHHGTPKQRGLHSMRNLTPMKVVSAPGVFAHPSLGMQPPGVPLSEPMRSKPPNVGPGQPPTGKSSRRERKTDAKPPIIHKKSSLNPMAMEFTPTYSTTPKQKQQDNHSSNSQPPMPAQVLQGWRNYMHPIQMHAVPATQTPQGATSPIPTPPNEQGHQNPHHQSQRGFQPQHTPRMVMLNGQPTYLQVPMQRQPTAQMLMPPPLMRMQQGPQIQQGPQMQRIQPMYIQHQAAGKADANKGHAQHGTASQQKMPNMPPNAMQPTSPFQNPLQQPQFFQQMMPPQVAVPGMFPTQYVLKQGNMQMPQQINQQNLSFIPRPGQAAPNQQGIPQWNGNIAQFAGMPSMQNMQNGQSQTPR